jgi:hypothetical protein
MSSYTDVLTNPALAERLRLVIAAPRSFTKDERDGLLSESAWRIERINDDASRRAVITEFLTAFAAASEEHNEFDADAEVQSVVRDMRLWVDNDGEVK